MPPKPERVALIEMIKAGSSAKEIVKSLCLPRTTVYDAIKRYRELGTASDYPRSGQPPTTNTPQVRKVIRSRIARNPRVKMRQVAKEIHVDRETIQKIAKNSLQYHPYKLQKAHLLTDIMKRKWLERCKLLIERHGGQNFRKILFSDEKLFTIQQSYNHQNDHIWSKTPPGANQIIPRSQKPKSLMAWAGFTPDGKLPLKFIDEGVKINQEMYRQEILEDLILPWTREHYPNNDWTFQQDSAPAHKAKLTQQWIQEHFPDFIDFLQWPPYSPNLNHLNYFIWSYLETTTCATLHKNLMMLHAVIIKTWDELPQ